MELQRTEIYERRAAIQFDRVLVTSRIDQQAFWELDREGLTHHKVSVLANGVDLDTFQRKQSNSTRTSYLGSSRKNELPC